ncbi:50S ribosomal protein L31 [bacterium]|jgi:large subunit ribosomal protein L31|nr:50S ribosomal protein L31 [bacterium]
MKKGIHPEIHDVVVRCACGNAIESVSTESKIEIDICSKCHPFFSGVQKFVDRAGRIERFQTRYGMPPAKKGKK